MIANVGELLAGPLPDVRVGIGRGSSRGCVERSAEAFDGVRIYDDAESLVTDLMSSRETLRLYLTYSTGFFGLMVKPSICGFLSKSSKYIVPSSSMLRKTPYSRMVPSLEANHVAKVRHPIWAPSSASSWSMNCLASLLSNASILKQRFPLILADHA